MIHFVILGAAASYYYFYHYKETEDKTNRAAETVIPPQEKKDLLSVKSTASRPLSLPPRAYVSSTFNPMGTSYTPVSDVNEQDAEKTIKVLNIANRFLYG